MANSYNQNYNILLQTLKKLPHCNDMSQEKKEIKSLDQLIGSTLQITTKPLETYYTKRVLTGIFTASDTSVTILLENTQESIIYEEFPDKTVNRSIGMISVPYDTIEKIEMKTYEYKKL